MKKYLKILALALMVAGLGLMFFGAVSADGAALIRGLALVLMGFLINRASDSILDAALITIALLVALPILFGCFGCAGPHALLKEMPRSAVVDDPNIKAMAPVLFSNRYSATNADVRVYKGHLQKSELIGNVGGSPVIYNDYIDKFRLMNAFGPNDPKVIMKMLVPGQTYTALIVVNWGAFGKIYDIYSVWLHPTKDPIRNMWTGGRGWDSTYVNDYVEVTGSNQPAYSHLNLVWTVYPNEIVRQVLFGGPK